jgi:hypothetical protein
LISSAVETNDQNLTPGFIDDTGAARPSDYAQLNTSGSALLRTEQEAGQLEDLALAIGRQSAGRPSVHIADGQDPMLLDLVENTTLQPSLQDPEIWRLNVEVDYFNCLLYNLAFTSV